MTRLESSLTTESIPRPCIALIDVVCNVEIVERSNLIAFLVDRVEDPRCGTRSLSYEIEIDSEKERRSQKGSGGKR